MTNGATEPSEADEDRQLWLDNAVTRKVLQEWRASYKRDVAELIALAQTSTDPEVRARGAGIAMQVRTIAALSGKADQ